MLEGERYIRRARTSRLASEQAYEFRYFFEHGGVHTIIHILENDWTAIALGQSFFGSSSVEVWKGSLLLSCAEREGVIIS